jgi:RND family efflux transporter MFP subunit
MIRGFALAALAVIGTGAFFYRPTPPPAPRQDDKRPHVEVSPPTRKTIYRRLNVPGEVRANQEVGIFSRVQGYLERVFVDRGSWVKAGDPLFKLSVPELERQLEKEQADLALCAPTIARDEATVAWRESTFKRIQEVSQKAPDLVTQESFDDAKGRLDLARAELELTRAREAGLKAAAEKTRAMIGFASGAAPFDGVITERWADPGDLVQPGQTKMLHLMQADPIRIRIHVPGPDVRFVRPDSKARIRFDELPGKEFEQTVSRLFWALRTATKTMAVEIDLANPDRSVRPGMFAHVSLELDARPNALVLPAAALVSEKKKTFVFVVRDGVAKKVPVKLGYDSGVEFEAAEGVSEADEVIVSGKNLVSDGEKVRTTRR